MDQRETEQQLRKRKTKKAPAFALRGWGMPLGSWGRTKEKQNKQQEEETEPSVCALRGWGRTLSGWRRTKERQNNKHQQKHQFGPLAAGGGPLAAEGGDQREAEQKL